MTSPSRVSVSASMSRAMPKSMTLTWPSASSITFCGLTSRCTMPCPCAHGQGIVHRDVKPQNVMLDADGHVKVMDFGIARLMDADTLTRDGDVIGTVAYMSPEQAAGRRVGPPSDVYSAGMVLY